MERVDSMLGCRGSIFLELSTYEKTSRGLLHWFLSHWRKQGGQASSCSRKWRSKEGPAQALHSCSTPVPLNKLNTAGKGTLTVLLLRRSCFYYMFWISCSLETPVLKLCTSYQLAPSGIVQCLLSTGWQESCFNDLGPVWGKQILEKADMTNHRRG